MLMVWLGRRSRDSQVIEACNFSMDSRFRGNDVAGSVDTISGGTIQP
jgi:hypothetical protein